MEKILNVLMEKENLILLLSCASSLCGVFISLITVRKKIEAERVIKKNIRKKYIQLYRNKHSSYSSEEIINQQVLLRLSELDELIIKIKNKENVSYTKEQKEHLNDVIRAVEKINLSTRDLEQPSQLGKLRYLEKVTKNIAQAH